ncbi:hypothetical protein ACFRJ9_14450 [Paenarthrobacter sp. NPDC056912]|uniref:hypothetical protein n=1 Tax=Paenarthrobacter sp. NPDC056912 TaxID=3345965 RepID=UPI00366B65B6
MTESQSPQDGSFATPRVGAHAGTQPFTGSYLDAPPGEFETVRPTTTNSGTGTADAGTVETAKQEAAGVAGAVGDAASGVVDAAKSEADNVAHEVKVNARQLLTQTKGELSDQARAQQQRVAEGLRSISDELSTMANSTENGGVATDLVQQAAQRSSSVAQWLDGRDPGSLLDELKGFARRKPGTFLLLAAGAGVLAGRLGRGMTGNGSPDGAAATGSTYKPAAGSTVPPPAVELPGPDATTASYITAPGGAASNGYDAGTTGGIDGSTLPYPETEAGGINTQGDPLAGSLEQKDPHYGGHQ